MKYHTIQFYPKPETNWCRLFLYAYSFHSCQTSGAFHLVNCQVILKMVQHAFWILVPCQIVSNGLLMILQVVYSSLFSVSVIPEVILPVNICLWFWSHFIVEDISVLEGGEICLHVCVCILFFLSITRQTARVLIFTIRTRSTSLTVKISGFES